MVKPLGIALIVAYNDADVAAMMRSKLAILGIDILMLVLLAAAIGCTQQDEPAPTLPATGTSEAAPTASPTDRSAPPPTIQPTVTPTSAPAIQPTHTPESVPTSEATNATDAKPTAPVVVTQTSDTSPECAGIDPTNTPDPNRPDGILGRDYQSWNVSTFEEAECIIDYSIAVPINLPEGFIRGENIIIHKRSTSHFEDRWVEHGWGIPGGPSYGFRVSQHSWKYSLGNGEPAVINGIPGQRRLRPAMPPDFPPLLTLLWEEDGYWYTVMGFLDGPITEEFLLDVAASLQPRDAIADTSPSAATPQECLALEPTSTPDTNPPEDGLGLFSESWELSSFDAAECITDYPVAVPTNLPEDFVRHETIVVRKSGTSHFEDRLVGQSWHILGDPSIGFSIEQHSWKVGLGHSEPAIINGFPGERLFLPAQSPDSPPLLGLSWEESGYWFTILGYLHGPITEGFLLEIAASLQFPNNEPSQ